MSKNVPVKHPLGHKGAGLDRSKTIARRGYILLAIRLTSSHSAARTHSYILGFCKHSGGRVSRLYHEGNRELQDQFDSRRLADRLEKVTVHDEFTAADREFIERRDMFFLATADAEGQPTCSYKGGDPGFVRIIDGRTLAFPLYDGNGMYLSAGNVLVNDRVGLLFIDFERQRRMRVNGRAAVSADDELMAAYEGAQAIVRVQADQIFPNCPRYIHRYVKTDASPYVPRGGEEPPVPDWKKAPWACDVLPGNASP